MPETTDISTIVATNPVAVFADPKTYVDLLKQIKAEAAEFEPDLSTAAGRKKIGSLAYKVTRTKTALDQAGKMLNLEARDRINKVDAHRRQIREDLDALAAQVRKPLTDWEEAEKARESAVSGFYARVRELKTLGRDDDSGRIIDRVAELSKMEVDPDVFLERTDDAGNALNEARESLRLALERAKQAEADASELERLRAENEARVAKEREAAEKAEEERRAREAAERAEAEAKRREEEAAERARAEERRKAENALARERAEKQALVDAQRKADEAKAEAERQAAAEKARREADEEHRARVLSKIGAHINAMGVSAKVAADIARALESGAIPHVEVKF